MAFYVGDDTANLIQIHSDPDYQEIEQQITLPRRIMRNLNGQTMVQYGLMTRTWTGSISFTNRNLIERMRKLYESEWFYFLDETEITAANDPMPLLDSNGDEITDSDGNVITDSGVPLQHEPVKVRWDGEFIVVYDEPTLYSGVILFQFVEFNPTDPNRSTPADMAFDG